MIYVSLGTNVGHRMAFLHRAIEQLRTMLSGLRYSIIIETEAIVPNHAPATWNQPFLNMIVSGNTQLSPDALLAALKQIEQQLGRPTHYEKWAPRVIDLDIVWWDALHYHTPTLTIPHKELPNRPFLQHLLHCMQPAQFDAPLTTGPYFSRSFAFTPALVGIVNITPDSFSKDTRDTPNKAWQAVQDCIAEGATIVELGAHSTRPGATLLTPEEEYARLAPVLDQLTTIPGLTVSLDSFQPQVIQKVLVHYSIAWINDVTGQLDTETLLQMRDQNVGYIAMHARTIPPSAQDVIPASLNPVEVVHQFFAEKLLMLQQLQFSTDRILLDPGIGFGKSMQHNWELLRHAHTFKRHGVPILIGHSRKSYLAAVTSHTAPERDPETVAISLALAAQGIDFLRVHHLTLHQRMLSTQQPLYSHHAMIPHGDTIPCT